MTAEIFLVDGPPGTGKTSFLSRQATLAADKHTPHSVAIASLTRTAAAEIAGRDHGIPDDQVGTLHAHAYRGLDRPDLAETPEGLRAWNDQHPSMVMTVGGAPSKLEDAPDLDGTGKTRADELHAACINHRARLTPRDQWTPEEAEHAALWDDFKAQTGRLDFTDLIEQAAESLPVHPANPRVMLLDEAQDFSALEMRLAMRWAQHTETTVIVGDTRQALYQWRGSDPDTLDRLQVTGRRVLEQSYRVPQAVHALAQRWISLLPAGPAAYKPTSQPGQAAGLPVAMTSADRLVDHIEQDLADGQTVMVLTSCGYMLAPLLHELRDRGLPFHNPYRRTQGAWNPMRAADRLAAFLRPDERVWGDHARAWTWADLKFWTDPLQAKGVLARGAKTFIDDKLRPDRFGETPMANTEVPIETICELFGTTNLRHHPVFNADVDWWADNLLASKTKQMQYPLQVLRSQGHAALRDQPRLVVGTIHSVKGGEADSVFVAPDLSRQGYWHGWTTQGPARDQIVRMFYVAITRARHKVTLLEPACEENVHGDLLDALGAQPRRPSGPRVVDLEAKLQERLAGRRAA